MTAPPRSLWRFLAGAVVLLLLFLIAGRLLQAWTRPRLDEDAAPAEQRLKALQELHAEDVRKLETYAWVDQSKGTVQLPIRRAMELTVEELRKRPPTPAGPIATPQPAASPTPSPVLKP